MISNPNNSVFLKSSINLQNVIQIRKNGYFFWKIAKIVLQLEILPRAPTASNGLDLRFSKPWL